MKIFSSRRSAFLEIGSFGLILVGISLTRLYNYILFHSIAELFSIVIATVIFIIAWTMRKEIDNSFFLVLGISSLFVAFLDIIHTLTYPGMNIIAGGDTNLASQFWIATRYMQALSVLGSLWAIDKKVRPTLLVGIYAAITMTILVLIFSRFFPNTFIEGSGLTLFKIMSEYIIILITIVAIGLFYFSRKYFGKNMYYLINAFFVAFMISEFFFTLYLSPYAHMNLVGHLIKIVAFYFLYKSIIQISLKNPIQSLFRKLNVSRDKFKEAYNRADFLTHLLAHDINNILQVILLEMEQCQMSVNSAETSEDLDDHLRVIENQVTEGSNLVSNVVKILRLEKEDISLKPVEINQLLKKKVGQLRERYQNGDLTIQIQSQAENLYVRANELLEEVFENLLSNAIIHNEERPLEILVQSSWEKIKNKRYIKIEVMDNGKGIEDAKKQSLLNGNLRYKKSSNGMGLGLSLVKKIIDQFHGKIWVEDRVKGDHTQGCNFIMLLHEVEKRGPSGEK